MPLLPSLMGQPEPQVVMGKGSGIDNINNWLKGEGLEVEEEKKLDLVPKIKNSALAKKRLLKKEEFVQIVRDAE
jgi:isopropylmalate/homocitrate/citramalate synthase